MWKRNAWRLEQLRSIVVTANTVGADPFRWLPCYFLSGPEKVVLPCMPAIFCANFSACVFYARCSVLTRDVRLFSVEQFLVAILQSSNCLSHSDSLLLVLRGWGGLSSCLALSLHVCPNYFWFLLELCYYVEKFCDERSLLDKLSLFLFIPSILHSWADVSIFLCWSRSGFHSFPTRWRWRV